MLAVVWFVPLLWGSGVLGLTFLCWRAVAWLKTDKSKDLLVLMGPKQNGKTEFLAALRGEDFDPDRPGTGLRLDPKECVWGEKTAVAIDEDGAESNIAQYVKSVLDYVSGKKPEYVVVALVVDMCELNSVEQSIERIGQYIDYIVDAFEGERKRGVMDFITRWDIDAYTKSVYKQGNWGYVLIGTHAKGMDDKRGVLEKVAQGIEKYRGRMRRLSGPKEMSVFELSEKKERESVVLWMKKIFKRIHQK